MTSERFEELVNLYLDNEIGRHELEELKRVLKENVMLRRQFERSCQVHQAARKALVSREPAAGSSGGGDSSTRHSTGRDDSRPRHPRPEAEPVSLKTSQRMAHVNASIPVLAERQMSRGAAKSVDVGKSAHKSGGGASSGGGSSRRGSSSSSVMASAGMGNAASVWAGLCLLGMVTITSLLYFSGYFAKFSPGDTNPIAGPDPDAAPLVTEAQKQEIINKILPGYTPGVPWKPAKAEDAFRDRLYTNDIGAGSVTRSMQVNYSASEAPGAAGGVQSSIWSMHVSEQMLVAPVNITIGPAESRQMNPGANTPLVAPPAGETLVTVPASVVPAAPDPSAPNSSSPSSNPVTPWVP